MEHFSSSSKHSLTSTQPQFNLNSVAVMMEQSEIDAKIAELEAEEEQERKETKKKHHVVITSCKGNRLKMADIIAHFTSDNTGSANEKLNHLPLDIGFNTKKEAVRFAKEIKTAGGEVSIQTS